MTIQLFRDITLCHIPEDLNPQLHCSQNLKTHFLKNLILRQNSSSPSSALKIQAFYVTMPCHYFCISQWLSVHLLRDMCASIFFSVSPSPPAVSQATSLKGLWDNVTSKSSCSLQLPAVFFYNWDESHSSQFYEGLTPTPYPTKFCSGNQMSQIFSKS
jgi:hypothetical protein